MERVKADAAGTANCRIGGRSERAKARKPAALMRVAKKMDRPAINIVCRRPASVLISSPFFSPFEEVEEEMNLIVLRSAELAERPVQGDRPRPQLRHFLSKPLIGRKIGNSRDQRDVRLRHVFRFDESREQRLSGDERAEVVGERLQLGSVFGKAVSSAPDITHRPKHGGDAHGRTDERLGFEAALKRFEPAQDLGLVERSDLASKP